MMAAFGIPPSAAYVIVAALWGCTNPFLKKGQEDISKSEATANKDKDDFAPNIDCATSSSPAAASTLNSNSIANWKIWNMCHVKVAIPFLINQSGSMLFYLLLSTEPLGTTVPIVNCLTFVFTALTSVLVNGEKVDSPFLLIAGTALVLAGMYLCSNAPPG
jgi:drug/metabolite transporter (DMT)-like permease